LRWLFVADPLCFSNGKIVLAQNSHSVRHQCEARRLHFLRAHKETALILSDATPDSAEEIASVHVASWQAAYRDLLPADFLAGLSIESRAQKWRELLHAGHTHAVLARAENGALAGWVSFGPSRDADLDATWGEIEALYIHPDEWRQGVGTHLTRHACAALRESGHTHVSLWVLEDNTQATAFYRRLGFTPDGVSGPATIAGIPLVKVRYVAELAHVLTT
jgi:ribosomal protein S18 acetylase RimI-like enzyme